MYPTDRHYSKDHEWVSVEGGVAKIGITDFAQSELGDIVFVELPEAGKEVKQGDVLGTIESVKAVSEIYAPLSGTVVAANDALNDTPEVINGDPHGAGWFCTLRMSEESETGGLMDAKAYKETVGS